MLTADAGDDIVIDYSFNNWDANHGPGAADNGDGTYTAAFSPVLSSGTYSVNLDAVTVEVAGSSAIYGALETPKSFTIL